MINLPKNSLIYVAGPYTKPEPIENLNRVMKFADKLVDNGYIPVIPHLVLFWHLVTPRPESYWYMYDQELLKRCDALVRLTGYSVGADEEVELAKELGIPIYYEDELPEL